MDDVAQIIELVGLDDGFGTEVVALEPVFVLGVQFLDIGEGDGHFGLAAAIFDAAADAADGTAQVDEEIGGLEFFADGLVELHIGVVIAFFDTTTAAEIFDEDLGIFIDGAVEDDALLGFLRLEVERELAREVENLGIESPAFHILIEIGDIGVVIDRLVERREAVSL